MLFTSSVQIDMRTEGPHRNYWLHLIAVYFGHSSYWYSINDHQQRIQDFPTRKGGANLKQGFQPKGGCQPIIWPKFAKNCMKMKKI